MHTLQTFYKSKKWEALLPILKAQRLNAEGQLICAYCGKPIVRAYDCIGHHVEPLTESNVNDVTVSLNPDNILFVHHRCHNKIHNKLGGYERRVYVVWGAPLSGKTTWVKENMNEGDLIIDIDSIWQCISGMDRYIKPARIKRNVFLVRDALIDQVKHRTGKWTNAYVIGGYPLISERERLVSMLGAQDIFIDVPKEECLLRLNHSNDRDKKEWERFILEWFDRYTPPTH